MLFFRYSHLLMVLSFGSVQARSTDAALAVAVNPVGFAGELFGVAVAPSDASPSPDAFTARTLKVYAVSFVSPVAV